MGEQSIATFQRGKLIIDTIISQFYPLKYSETDLNGQKIDPNEAVNPRRFRHIKHQGKMK